jgi:hypothetical protein
MPPAERSHTEVALSVVEDIERTRLDGSTPLFLPKDRELNLSVLKGSCKRYCYSRWETEVDSEGEPWLIAKETMLHQDLLYSELDWLKILKNRMLVADPKGIYIREGSLISDLSKLWSRP